MSKMHPKQRLNKAKSKIMDAIFLQERLFLRKTGKLGNYLLHIQDIDNKQIFSFVWDDEMDAHNFSNPTRFTNLQKGIEGHEALELLEKFWEKRIK